MMNIVKIFDKIYFFKLCLCPMFVVVITHGDDATILSQHEKRAHANLFKQVNAQQYCSNFTVESRKVPTVLLWRRAVKQH